VLRTLRDTFQPDRLRAPARPLPQIRATSSRSHVSDRSAPGTTRNPASYGTIGGKPVSRTSESMSQTNLRGFSSFSATASIVCQIRHKLIRRKLRRVL
jgi:hypothetical protein